MRVGRESDHASDGPREHCLMVPVGDDKHMVSADVCA